MTFYRFDVQYGVPYDPLPDGFYWCSQVWYANASNPAEYAHAKEGAVKITTLWLNVNVLAWRMWARLWPSEVMVENIVAPQYEHPYLSGPYGPMEGTVYVSLLSEGKQVSYKRVRSPLRFGDYDEQGNLEPTVLAYYQSVADMIAAYGCFTNEAGVPIDEAIVSPYYHNWQMRHGTKRRQRRRLV
jgi:hypothetical protein